MADLVLILLTVLTLVLIYLLSLIAKFYNLRSGKGVNHKHYYLGGLLVMIGLLANISFLKAGFLEILGPISLIIGCILLVLLTWNLYKSMMSVKS